MKILGSVLVVAIASLVALPGAQARPRLGPALVLAPLAIVGGIAGAAMGSRKARAHRAYQARYKARRERGGSIRQARPAAPNGEVARPLPAASRAAPAGWAGPLFWPYAYDGVFEYAFGLPGDDNQFWARGFGDVVEGMFAPPTRGPALRRVALSDEQPSGWENRCGSERPKAAEATVERIRQTVQPSEAQQVSLNELGAALARATERIEGVCPTRHAATPPERLYMMIARLTAMRQAVLTVQAPLRNFYEQLTDEQKSALERAGSQGEASNARADANANAGCAAPVANWPEAQIERTLRPTKEQRAHLEQLRRTSLGLAQFVASSCPQSVPRTAPERLDAIKDRLAVLRYAANNVSPAYERFYGSLSEEQKARFQTMSGDRRAEARR